MSGYLPNRIPGYREARDQDIGFKKPGYRKIRITDILIPRLLFADMLFH